MSSSQRQTASGQNGAKSRRPITDLGKQRSARNATRHGLLCATVVFEDEDPKEFKLLLRQHVEKFQPNGDIEHQAVEEMASCQGKLRRLRLIEKTAIPYPSVSSMPSRISARRSPASIATNRASPACTTAPSATSRNSARWSRRPKLLSCRRPRLRWVRLVKKLFRLQLPLPRPYKTSLTNRKSSPILPLPPCRTGRQPPNFADACRR